MKKMTNKENKIVSKKNPLTQSIRMACIGGLMGLSSLANALSFERGDFSLTFDTTISYGASFRVAERDNRLVGKANLDPFVGLLPLEQQLNAPGRFSVNSDDGNLKYDDGDVFSNAIKWTSDLSFDYNSWGGFFRFSYFYDFENEDRDDISDVAKIFIGERFRLLDAYVFKDFDIGESAFGSVRLGRQVVSWGESTFIQQGINVINPVDVSKLRVAGAELKEAFLPLDMINVSISFNENLSMEAIYMFEFEQTDPDPAGTYFGTNDFATPGGEYVMLGFGRTPQCGNVIPLDPNDPNRFICEATTALPPELQAAVIGSTIQRDIVPGADDNGQFGLAFNYYAPALNDTEFGFYYLNYHSRLPLISGTTVTTGVPNSGRFFTEYPEDIDLYGLSFNTTINSLGMSLQGELSYRPNVPLQIDDVEVLFSALSPLNALIPAEYNRFVSQLGDFGPGEYIRGWERHEVSQLQFTATKLFGPNNPFRANQIAFVGEVGFTNVWDLPAQDVLRYQGPGSDTGGGPSELSGGNSRNPVTLDSEFFPSSFSWGYRLLARFEYNNAFGSAFNLLPRIAFNHDVNGTTPGPGGNFIEDRKSLTLGMEAVYLETWSADISYTNFSGAGIRNLIGDRDFASINFKYSF
ncbi:DUF1302 domain-containing protein [Marinicella sp. W31]|uniref:DUF1302 domain-containing protein n=1 Tax=Marinicella sp. W31 TaxID=3023713 RepID=UPI0037576B1B